MIKIYHTENCTFATPFKAWTFPAGERGFELLALDTNEVTIECMWQGSDDLIDIINAVSAIRDADPRAVIDLDIPYFPFGCQDRRTTSGSPNSLKAFAAVINSLNFNKVLTDDPHSDVMPAVVDRLVIKEQFEAVVETISAKRRQEYDYLISPDAGALKKIYKLAKYMNTEVICASKQRELSTGAILKSYISLDDYDKIVGKRLLIVDDIGDGMGTFIGLAKTIRENQPEIKQLDVYVTHGIFSKGLDILEGLFDKVYTYNLMNESVKSHALLAKTEYNHLRN